MDGNTHVNSVERRRIPRAVSLIGFSFLFLGAVSGTAWLYIMERNAAAPLRTSDKFIKAMFDKDIDTAYAMTTSTFQSATSREEFKEVAELVSRELQHQTLTVETGEVEEIDGIKRASLKYSVKGSDNENYDMTVKVEQRVNSNDKRWLILSVTNEERV